MPIWDQITMAVTIRSTGTVWTSTPIEPVLPIPIPIAVTSRASIQSGTWAAAPARAIPAVASTTDATTSGRGRRLPASAALAATMIAAAT